MIREPLPVQEREADWLRLMEGALSLDFAQTGIENILRFVAPLLDTNDHSRFAEASKHRPLAWKIMQAAVAHLRGQGRDAIRDAIGGPLAEWALDVAEGKLTRPLGETRGRHLKQNLVRDVVIAATVAAIRDLQYRPIKASTPDEGGSICHIVADRSGYSYGTVYRVWKEYRSQVEEG